MKLIHYQKEFPYFPQPGHCLLRIFQSEIDESVHTVLLTEVSDNPGQSVTNAIEKLATQAVKRFGLLPGYTTIVEHHSLYQAFNLVEMVWLNGRYLKPHWKDLSEEEVAQYIPAEYVVREKVSA